MCYAIFEKLVIDLLVKMGYGGSQADAEAVGRSGDGGNVGVSTTKTYEIKRVDSDYFAEDTETS